MQNDTIQTPTYKNTNRTNLKQLIEPTPLNTKSSLNYSKIGIKKLKKRQERERGEKDQEGHTQTTTRITIRCKENPKQVKGSKKKDSIIKVSHIKDN